MKIIHIACHLIFASDQKCFSYAHSMRTVFYVKFKYTYTVTVSNSAY